MVVGNIKETFSIYSDNIGTEMGIIRVGETGIVIETEKEGKLAVPFDYIKSIESDGEINLGKVKVEIVFFDIMGERHEMVFMISDMNLGLLKKACEK
ncbi:MAG: hypothetical protein ABIG39_08030 [Candidatus Micrarchaeota archaeon]